MRHHIFYYIFLLVILYANHPYLSAQEFHRLMQHAEESMEQKLVSGANRRTEKISSSLSVSTVFTQTQIKELHVSSLYELLSYVPGFELTESFFGYTTVNVRGVLQANYNNKILFLINGHPFLDGVNGSAHLEVIPIQAISKVEIIRGPGSVLYGTNAYAGVIAVETLEGSSYEKGSFYMETGNNHTNRMGINMVLNNGTRGGLFLSSDLVSQNSWLYKAETANPIAPFDYSSDLQNLYLNWKNQNITLQFGHFTHDKMRFGFTMNPGMSSGINKFDGTFLDFSWLHQSKDNSQLKVRYGYTEQERIYYFPPPTTPTYNPSKIHHFELSYDQKISQRLRNITGFSHEQLIATRDAVESVTNLGQAYLGARKHETSINAFFTQFDYELHKKMGFLFSARLTDNSDSGQNSVPRLGAIYNFKPDFNVKLLYGQAFRSANHFENRIDLPNYWGPVALGQSPLKDERINQWDLVFEKKQGHFSHRLNFFHLKTEDMIEIRRIGFLPNGISPVYTYFNSTGQKIKGVELEINGKLSKQTSLRFNATLREGKNLSSNEPLRNISRLTSNLSINHKLNDKWSGNYMMQHLGKRDGILADDSLFYLSDSTIMHVSCDYKINQQNTLSLFIKNIGNHKLEHFEYNEGFMPTLPGGPGRSIFLRFEKRF